MKLVTKKLGLMVSITTLVLTTLALTTIVSCSKQAVTNTDLSQDDLYIRGAFNGWGTENPLVKQPSGKYRSTISVGLGIHAFKVASNDWSLQMLLASDHVIDLEHDQNTAFPLAKKNVDYNSQILTPQPAQFDIVVDTSVKPVNLIIENVLFKATSIEQPHGDKGITQLQYEDVLGQEQRATFSVAKTTGQLKTYVHATTQLLRDPVPQHSTYSESSNLPYVRSGNIAFDALFALSMDEMKLNSVANIKDGNYNLGKAIACPCFETGEKWNYVWTRDLSYAAQLGLGFFDPKRVVNSLLFKTSPFREEVSVTGSELMTDAGTQILQDTGSGGSWPISTDRVTWAFGAESVLANIADNERSRFARKALDALINTIELDRIAIFNSTVGLYQGEQSFLDWREQSYAQWIVDDLSSMATSMSLSTNVAHYQALTLAAKLASETNNSKVATRYQQWADELKQHINDFFWLPEQGLYSSLSSGHHYPVAMQKYDWLGQSLAIITGIADQTKTEMILKRYPHSKMGAPVIFPQQPGIQIYHNRAIWPFVTAFGLQAAKRGNNAAVATNAIESIIRGAALNLSNMENLEWLSGQSIWLDREQPQQSGPAINSKRQLWSVAGYINMVVSGIFGVDSASDGLSAKSTLKIDPYLPTDVALHYFSGQTEVVLHQLNWLGKSITLTLNLPSSYSAKQVLRAGTIKLNNQVLKTNTLEAAMLLENNEITVDLVEQSTDNKMTLVTGLPSNDNVQHFAPVEPNLTLAAIDSGIELHIDDVNTATVTFNVYKNGLLVAENLTQSTWQDSPLSDQENACYNVSAQFKQSGTVSHLSKTVCAGQATQVDVDSNTVVSNIKITPTAFGNTLQNWGSATDKFELSWQQATPGKVALQFRYRNLNHSINTGITAGVKAANIRLGDMHVAEKIVQMPHTKPDAGIGLSTPIYLDLKAGQYTLSLTDFYNMSYLTTNETYSSAGGVDGQLNQFDLYGIVITPLD
ncbi:esterase [Psychrosphaera sp. B3R10]|uniref:alpha-L-rhamnosidase-related protein n=1 Tax=unclassified Psychrosphaera TaxID=2641570 RepID=UPI001C07FB31|nr:MULTISPECIES: esterase [unclassified Psychrosphaera]MBU2883436.1 esterase [Psychrosphaera sp. I2R16]MBU2990470.1 esterase [Psychrosphaera sp. B3R10]